MMHKFHTQFTGKNHMASGNILTQDFWANPAIFQCCVLAYNLLLWMMWLNEEDGFSEEPNTIRMCLINVPAKLMTRSRLSFDSPPTLRKVHEA